MKVGPCIKILGPKMIKMISTALVYCQKYKETQDIKYKAWKDVDSLYTEYLDMCNQITSVYSILNRRRYPGLSTNPTHIHELSVFDNVYKWFTTWRDESFQKARSKGRVKTE
jgi:hypothetical protein